MPNPVASNYDPKYVSLDDIPVSGPDTYDVEGKRKALFQAESSLELDVNNGEQIEDRNLLTGHQSAVMYLATHVLTHAAEEPGDVTLGDMADDGGQITNYSSRYLEEYNRLVDQLDAISGGSADNYSIAVNTGSDRVDSTEYARSNNTEGASGPES